MPAQVLMREGLIFFFFFILLIEMMAQIVFRRVNLGIVLNLFWTQETEQKGKKYSDL